MSQLRDISVKLRAAIAIVAVWSLMFSVSASCAVAADASDVILKNGAATSGGLFACFKRHMTQRAEAANEKAPAGQSSGKHHCPLCLAAHTAPAVLAARLSSPAIRLAAPSSRVAPPALTTRAPESLALRSAHGARAPPLLI